MPFQTKMNFRCFILLLTSCLLSIRCKNDPRNNLIDNNAQIISNYPSEDAYLGKWAYTIPLGFSSVLKISEDSTFTYDCRSCLRDSYTEGNWFLQANEIVLRSHKEYSPDSLVISMPKHPDAFSDEQFEFDYFNDVRLKLESDTLYRLDNNGIKTNLRYHLVLNY